MTLNYGDIMGFGVYANGVCSGLSLSGNSFEGNESAHVFLHQSNATVGGNTYVANGILDFQQQRCEGCVTVITPDLTDPPYDVEICPATNDPVWPIDFNLELEESVAAESW
jgi:hypothetical protein